MRIVAYKFFGDELVVIYIISKGRERRYSTKVFSHRLERLAKVISGIYNENPDRIPLGFELSGYDVALGVL